MQAYAIKAVRSTQIELGRDLNEIGDTSRCAQGSTDPVGGEGD